MRKLSVFNSVSLDGYFTDAGGDMGWAHRDDDEWSSFTVANAGGGGALLFGRVTYQMMASFWPTPAATATMPEVAAGMNAMPKYVASRTMSVPAWQNTILLEGDLATAVGRLKRQPGPDLVILGSGTLVAQLAAARLIDSYQLALAPIVLGAGRTLFEGVRDRQWLQRRGCRTFANGNVVLSYEPA
jgi:dihydrofolate reductase